MSGPRVAVLSLAPHIEDRLLPALADAGVTVAARPAGPAEAADAVRRHRPDLLIASAAPAAVDPALLATATAAGTVVVLLAEGDLAAEYAETLGTSAIDAAASCEQILATADASRPEAQPPARIAGPVTAEVTRQGRGRVTAVWGPTGAPGRTTTAITLAAELAGAGVRTALVDADTVGAAIAPALGLFDEAPGLAAACRLAAAGALTPAELDRVAQHARGARGTVSVLTGIGRPSRWPELSTDRVTKVLDRCREWAEHTVVDAGFNLEADEEIVSDLFAPRRNAATLASLRAADLVVAVGAADPVGLARFVRAYGDLVEVVEPERIRVVITKVRDSAVGLGAGGQIRASLLRFGGIEDVTLVPNDAPSCDAALLTARPLPDTAPRSAATAALRRFAADHLIDLPVAERRRRLLPFRRAATA